MHGFPFSGFDISYAAYGGIGKVFFGDTPNPVRGLRPLHPLFCAFPNQEKGFPGFSIPRQGVKRPASPFCAFPNQEKGRVYSILRQGV
jgi:hypothetical protein